jgi:hypothetical protein
MSGTEEDWPAIEQRLGLMLHQFATKVIGESVKVDPKAAESAIHYCRHRVAGGACIPEREEHFLHFVDRSCGSMMWVMYGDIADLLVGYAIGRLGRAKPPPYCGLLYEVTEEVLDDDINRVV